MKSYFLTLTFAITASFLSTGDTGSAASQSKPAATTDKLIYTSTASGNQEIMRVDSDGANATNLTNNPASDFAPAYNPTLDKIAFVSNRTGTNQIWVMNADGTSQVDLSASPANSDSGPSWSPDGSKIVFYRDGSPDFSEDGVWTMNADGTSPARIYYLSGFAFPPQPQFSPDGVSIAIREGSNLITFDTAGMNIANLASGLDDESPVLWSPDGLKLLYLRNDGSRAIYTLDAASGANETNLTPLVDSHQPGWSADGRIVYSERFGTGNFRIVRMNADGSGLTPVSTTMAASFNYRFPVWSPDESRIAFTGTEESTSPGLRTVNVVPVQTGQVFIAQANDDRPVLWVDRTIAPRIRVVGLTVDETSGTVGVTVLRSGNLSSASSINYQTTDGTATAGTDYTATSGTVNFASGEAVKTFNVSVINDTQVENVETVLLSLANPSNATLDANSNAVLTIVSDDSGFSIAPESLNQTVSEAATSVTFRIVRSGTLTFPGSVNFTPSGGTATEGDDWVFNVFPVDFAPNETEKFVSVMLVSDNLPEPNEFFVVTLSNPAGGTIGADSQTNANIADDDSTHSIVRPVYTIQESQGSVAVTVRRSDSTVATSVAYQTLDGTATQSADYTATTGTLNFAVGISQLTVNIPITISGGNEPTEAFQFQLLNPSPGNLGQPDNAIVRILDGGACRPVAPDLISWWPGDFDTLDVRSRNDGQLQDEANFAFGKNGHAFSFDGSGDAILIGNPASANPTSVTVEAWINSANIPGGGTIQSAVAKWGFDTPDDQYLLGIRGIGGGQSTVFGAVGDGIFDGGFSGSAVIAANTWTHIAMTYNAADGRNVLYQNGVQVASRNRTLTAGLITTNTQLYIGREDSPQQRDFNGLIDEPSIYRRALSPAEIQAIYNANTDGKCKPTATVTPSGPVGWWPGDGNATDISGNGNHATLQNGTRFSIDKVGQGFQFDGTDDRILVSASSSLNVGASSGFSVEGWVNPTSNTVQQPVWEWNSGGPTTPSIGAHLWLSDQFNGGVPGNLFANIRDTAGNNHFLETSTGVMAANEFQHIALTYDKTTGEASILRNGVVVANANLGTFTPQTTSDLYFGNRPGSLFFNGKMDEFAVYDRTLSTVEIASIYNAGLAGKLKTNAVDTSDLVGWWKGETNALDSSGYGNNASASGGLSYSSGHISQAFIFDGTGEVVAPNAPSLNPTAQITVESWVYPTTDSMPGNAMAIIANKETSGSVQYEISRRLTSGSCPSGTNSIPAGNFAVYIGGITGLPNDCGGWVNGNGNLPLNSWSHVAMTYDGANLRAYVNGSLTRTVAASGTILASSGSFRLGSRIIVPERWQGGIDEAAIWRRALTTAEIAAIYSGDSGRTSTNASTKSAVAPGSNLLPVFPATVGDATVTFPALTWAGTTQQIPLDPALFPPVPMGTHTGLFYDIATSAAYTGSPTICFNLPAFSTGEFSALRVLHFDNGSWINVTDESSTSYPSLCTDPVGSLSPFAIVSVAPTAASASVSGRVVDSAGIPIPRAQLKITGADGVARPAISNPFGYFTFENVEVGNAYLISTEHKRYQFEPRTVVVNDNITDLAIVASP